MLRSGKITAIDVQNCTARVTFADDGIVSDFLQIVVMGALSTKFFHMFDINEQVAVLMDENSEEGVILGALYNKGTKPDPAVTKDKVKVLFPDESFIEYDRESHEFTADIKGKINIKSDSEVNIEAQTANVSADTVEVDATQVTVDADTVTIDAMMVDITGTVDITGNVIVSGTVTAAEISAPIIGGGGVSMSSGNLTASGDIEATGQVKGATVKQGAIELGTHKHTGVTTGPGTTGTPTP